jgi:hypothetical protein
MFPVDAGWPSGLYLGLYVLTLAVHAGLIGYVLAGAGYAAVAAVRPDRPDGADPIAAVLRDWLPFALGAAITAGVAPLLFVQLLYQERFYTANLLLFHRWMAIVPVLIVSFYLLYLHKTERFTGRAARAAIIGTAALGFLFVAWSWTENHLLQLDDGVWRDFYAAGRLVYGSEQLAPRVLTWVMAALPSMAIGAAWQVRGVAGAEARPTALRRLAVLALVGVAGSAATAAWLWAELPEGSRVTVLSGSMVPWLAALVVARGAEVGAWGWIVRSPDSRRALIVATTGGIGAHLAGACLREAIRLGHLEAIRPPVADAGGLPAFAISMVAMVGALIWMGRMIRRGLAAGAV